MVQYMIQQHHVSQRQACQAVSLPRSSFAYQAKKKNDEEVIEQLNILTEKHPSIGFWKCYYRLRKKGFLWNHKRVYRVYKKMRLNIRRRAKKRLPARVKQPLYQPAAINEVWSLDYMSDSLWDSRKFRVLNIMDDCSREVLAAEADTSLPALRLIRILEQLRETRGVPQAVRVDNGPEFISRRLADWCQEWQVTLMFIQPGKPTQNGYVERLNGSLRRELLDAYIFGSLDEVRQMVEAWRRDFNYERPHQSLNHQTPVEYALANTG